MTRLFHYPVRICEVGGVIHRYLLLGNNVSSGNKRHFVYHPEVGITGMIDEIILAYWFIGKVSKP